MNTLDRIAISTTVALLSFANIADAHSDEHASPTRFQYQALHRLEEQQASNRLGFAVASRLASTRLTVKAEGDGQPGTP